MSFLLEILMLFCFFNLNQALYLQDNTTNAQQDAQHICSLDPGHGDCCEEKKLKFHYNPDSRICYEILHKGCEGNNNTFDTMEQCETSCAGDRHGNCLLSVDFGDCCNRTIKFYYNRFTGECHEFIYNGCAGNRNIFDTREECETFCEGNAINKTEHCNKEGDRGTCEGLIHRFYYNSTLHECRGLEYGGCRGNANNFSTKQDCIRVCINFM
ncbi:tissue factor pathway inhibitor-like isoform X2 [Stegodyphus dumicola]|uniref:tissue factor pathway inhibitor-like isoform X2 n=1 Tax=Stegodyphus dumicola TaxID=202533 RepID=UPI0015AD1FA1|nr:tissue factor pathway inhibitor-like isoform X2 [Stegodyphus dumicola]